MSSPKDMRKGFAIVGATLLAVIIALLLVVLTGCASPEESFVSDIRSNVLGTEDESVRDIVSLGVSTCGALGRGASEADVLGVFADNGLTAREGQAFLDAAQKWICDE